MAMLRSVTCVVAFILLVCLTDAQDWKPYKPEGTYTVPATPELMRPATPPVGHGGYDTFPGSIGFDPASRPGQPEWMRPATPPVGHTPYEPELMRPATPPVGHTPYEPELMRPATPPVVAGGYGGYDTFPGSIGFDPASRPGQPEWMKPVPIPLPATPPIQRPATPPIQRPATPPMQRPATPPMQRPATPPMQRPATPPMQRPATPPMQRPATPPMQRPATPPMQRPATPPMQRPETPPMQRPATPPMQRPETPPMQRPATPPMQRPATPPMQRPETPPMQRPATPPMQRPATPPMQRPATPPMQRPATPPMQRPATPPVQGPIGYDPASRPGQQPGGFDPASRPGQQPGGFDPARPPPDTSPPIVPQPLNCEVENSFKIQCGPPQTSGAECAAMSCCFDGQQCFYGKAVTVQVTKDGQFVVVVARDATLPNLDLDGIRLLDVNDPQCRPVASNEVFAIYQFPVTACGTIVMEQPGVIIYENRMVSSYEVAVGSLGSITRDTHYELVFQGWYHGMSVETVLIEVKPLRGNPRNIIAPGILYLNMRLGSGQCTSKGCFEHDVAYNTFYTQADYPLGKYLRDPLYVAVQVLDMTDPNMMLTLERCWATASREPHSMPQWELINDGCPYRDDRYLTTPVPIPTNSVAFPTHHKRFIVKMFTFVGQQGGGKTAQSNQVFLHCSTTICSLADANCMAHGSRCNRRRRDVFAAQKTRGRGTVVSSGAVILSDPSTQDSGVYEQ